MIKVLFLSAWYPNRYDAMAGLFVRKHAEAVSLYCDVKVLYVHGDKHITEIEIIKQNFNKVEEYIIYFPENNKGVLRRIHKMFSYIKAIRIGIQTIKKTSGLPDIVHVNILTRSGILAYWLKKSKNIPYIITEHWTRYLPSRRSYSGILRKFITKLIVKNASAVLPVSEDLKNAMISHHLINNNYQVVNNVVEDIFFENHRNSVKHIKNILHVSCFDDNQKNITGILRVIAKLTTLRDDFRIVIVGTGIDFNSIIQYSETLNIPSEFILFTGELSPSEVADEFFHCDFFLMFSNHENSPVVISESLSCGKPVLSSDVGGISEHVNESNGILIKAKDENALLEEMIYMLDHFQEYDAMKIKEQAKEKFSYKLVGSEIFNSYKKALTKKIK
ncbi:MAG: glycosyltransferase [Paludibacter sp.]|nr:glycosyltransferase [Paludibacter sp.]